MCRRRILKNGKCPDTITYAIAHQDRGYDYRENNFISIVTEIRRALWEKNKRTIKTNRISDTCSKKMEKTLLKQKT